MSSSGCPRCPGDILKLLLGCLDILISISWIIIIIILLLSSPNVLIFIFGAKFIILRTSPGHPRCLKCLNFYFWNHPRMSPRTLVRQGTITFLCLYNTTMNKIFLIHTDILKYYTFIFKKFHFANVQTN